MSETVEPTVEQAVDNAAPSQEAPEAAPKRTRRTRAKSDADAATEVTENAAPAEQDAPADEAAPAAKKTTTAKKTTAKRTTTRKTTTRKTAAKKTAADDAAAAPAADEAAQVSKADEAAEEKPAPKKRTRRTTKKAADAEAATEQLELVAEGEEKPAPKKRTRRTTKKAAEAAESATAEKAAAEQPTEAAEAAAEKAGDGQVVEEKKPVRRRRTTRKAAEKEAAAEQAAEGKAAEAKASSDGEATASEAPADSAQTPEAAAAGEKGASDEGKPESDASEKKDESEDKGGERDRRDNNNRRNRRNRRNRKDRQRKEIVPSATRDELAKLEDEALIAKACELDVDPTEYGERDDLVSAVYDALLQAEGFVMVEGILDLLPDGYGFIRTDGYLPGEHDVYVGMSTVRRNGLRKGDYISGRVRPPRDNEKYPALNTIIELNNEPFEGPTHRVKFANLTPIYPDERLIMEHGKDTITARAIDLVSPIGKGQRGLIVSPPKAGKTTVLKDIAAAISANNPEVHLMCLLVDERPEEVTDMERSIDGEVISSTFDMPSENHIAVAELVIERAKRLVENGQDVVILLDSITRLARAYNLSQPASGRILSGGVDSTALYPPKRFLGAARNIEFGGSLTILGTALIDTGSKMDEVIFEEFKGTGNMELKLDRNLADKRIFPAIDPVASSTRKDDLLVDPQEAPLIWGLRRLLANMNNTERAMKMLIQSLKQTETNQEFLIKSARKASKSVNL